MSGLHYWLWFEGPAKQIKEIDRLFDVGQTIGGQTIGVVRRPKID